MRTGRRDAQLQLVVSLLQRRVVPHLMTGKAACARGPVRRRLARLNNIMKGRRTVCEPQNACTLCVCGDRRGEQQTALPSAEPSACLLQLEKAERAPVVVFGGRKETSEESLSC